MKKQNSVHHHQMRRGKKEGADEMITITHSRLNQSNHTTGDLICATPGRMTKTAAKTDWNNEELSLRLGHATLLRLMSLAIWLSACMRIQQETSSHAEVLADGRCTYDLIRSCSKDAAWAKIEDPHLQKKKSSVGVETPLFELMLPCRELSRFTRGTQEAKTCLQGRHVVFVGDSVTRYMYLI
jgi:hypothetical protein